MNVQDIDLNVSKERSSSKVVRIGQGDKAGTTIRATIRDGAVAATLTGLTAKFLMKTPGGGYVEDVHVNVSGSTLTYVVDEEHCAGTAGTTDECYFQILDGTTVRYSTERFTMRIYRSATQGADPAQSYSDDIVAATQAARDAADAAEAAMQDIGTAVEDAAAAAESAAQAVTDAQTAIADADTAKQQATTAANTANTAATNANDKATAANNAASSANTAAGTANDASARAEAAISAMGDISEQAVPLMSSDTRGGAKLGDGLAVDDGTLHVGALAKASTGEVYAPLASVSAKGWAEQDTTTGKNLIARSSSISTSNIAPYVSVLEDGSIRLNTLPSDNKSGIIGTASLTSGVVYTLSGGASQAFRLYMNVDGTTYTSSTASETFTPSNDVNVDVYVVILTTAVVGSVLHPQLELGSTATDYEPYTGGAPSPSPDYPQEIRVARGRNLIDTTAVTSGKYLASDGTTTDDATYSISDYIAVDGGATYVTSGMGAVSSAYYAWYTSAKAYISATQQTANGFTLTAPANAAYVRVSLLNASLGTSQLEFGSTPTPYVPYGHVGLEVQSKNQCYWKSFSNTTNRTVRLNDDGTVTANGAGNCYMVLNKPAKAGQYFCIELVSGSTNTQIISDSSIFTGGYNAGDFGQYKQFKKDIQHLWLHANASFSNCILKLSVTDEVPDHWIPYFESTTPIPLPDKGFAGSLPDGTADELRIDGAGKVSWEKRTEKKVLGDYAWAAYSDSVGQYFRAAFDDIRKPNASEVAGIICEGYIASASTNVYDGAIAISIGSNSYIYVRSLSYSDATEFSNATDDFEFLYPLATPTTEDMGYVDLPSIPSDAIVSIPELEDFGCTFWVDEDGSIHALAAAYEQRTLAEVAEARTQALANVAPVEGAKASTNYAVGTYLVHDGKLCKVTSAIATGESITIGTNVTATTVAAEILAIDNS